MAVEPGPSTRYARAWTRWDGRQLARAATAAALTFAVAWLVTAATDEGGVAAGERAGRTLPLTPFCAAIGAWVALAPVVARGEALALEALGRSRPQIAASAVLGGALVALTAALGLGLVRAVDVRGFFPTATHGSVWTWTGTAFTDAVHGLRVGVDGAPVRIPAEPGRTLVGIPRYGRAAASAATFLAGLALPLLLAHALLERARALPLVLLVGTVIAASVVAFQAAAAGHIPAALAALPSLALLALAVWRYLGGRRRRPV
jgi:hypothetical protein